MLLCVCVPCGRERRSEGTSHHKQGFAWLHLFWSCLHESFQAWCLFCARFYGIILRIKQWFLNKQSSSASSHQKLRLGWISQASLDLMIVKLSAAIRTHFKTSNRRLTNPSNVLGEYDVGLRVTWLSVSGRVCVCVWKRSALYVILQSSFVSAAMNGIPFLEAPVRISETYQKIDISHTFPFLRATFTRKCITHIPHLQYLMSLGRGMITRVFIRTAVRYGRCGYFSATGGRTGSLFALSHFLSDYWQKMIISGGNDVW